MSILAALSGFQYLLTILLIAVCIFLILVILLQRGRGGGLAAAFGGSGGGSSAFGAKTGDVFTIVTVILASVYMLIAVVGNYFLLPPGEGDTPGVATLAPGGGAAPPATGSDSQAPRPAPAAVPTTDETDAAASEEGTADSGAGETGGAESAADPADPNASGAPPTETPPADAQPATSAGGDALER